MDAIFWIVVVGTWLSLIYGFYVLYKIDKKIN